MSKLQKVLELVANLSIICVALVLGMVLVKNYLLPKTKTETPLAQISPGAKVPLADMDWGKKDRTLIFALAKGCHFCSENAPLYQKITSEAQISGKLRLIFVFPHDVDEGKKYLSELGIKYDEVREVPFKSIGVTGTPTLILTDNSGTVVDRWMGKVRDAQEEQLLAELRHCQTCD